MNIVIVSGTLVAAPSMREVAGAGSIWTLELATTAGDGGPRLDVTVVWQTEQLPDAWVVGAELAASGTVRRRFFRVGGATQSRTEVVAADVVEVTRRRPSARALARVATALGDDQRAALRSAVG